MSCCGKTRSEFKSVSRTTPGVSMVPPSLPRVEGTGTPVRFEYQGRTGLSVRGPITGRSYRFNGPGEQVAVDTRDAPSLRAVPNLRAVR